jgi:uncharacterized protein YndB with AHSA1/START domain
MGATLNSLDSKLSATSRPASRGCATAECGPLRPMPATIALSASVDADAQRIFHALTVPEYLEAWIAMPGSTAGEVVASHEENGFRLDRCVAGHAAMRISAAFLFRHQRKMRLVWRKAHGARHERSVVDFRIRGNFASSVLELRHMGLDSAEEVAWHRALWQGSLKKLSSLLRSA